jgi:hypothetical protein
MEQRITSIAALLLGVLHSGAGHAQDLRIHRVDGGVELHAIADIRSITFTGPALNVHYLDGGTVATPFDEIRSYAFTDLNTGTGSAYVQPALWLHPNPTDGPVRVHTPGAGSTPVHLEVIDAQGRVVDRWRSAPAPDGTLTYDPAHLGTGLFLLRVARPDHVHTIRLQVR